MSEIYQEGTTDLSIDVIWVDKATGEYVGAVAHNADGIQITVKRRGLAAITQTTLVDGSNVAIATDAHTDWQMIEAGDGVHHRLDLPDTTCASGMATGQKVVKVSGFSDDYEMLPVVIQLSDGVPGGESPSAEDIALEVQSLAEAEPLAVNVAMVNDVPVQGAGTSGNRWRPT